jgi:nitrogen regulatory protein P-II 2
LKYMIAIIQTYRLDAVREALLNLGLEGMTVSEVRGYGRQKGHKEIYRGAEYVISFVPKIKIEVAVPADRADAAVAAIRGAAHSGEIGDGKIFVLDLESAIRIRTGESGDDAL